MAPVPVPVYLYVTTVEAARGMLGRYHALLAPEERARHARFRVELPAHEFLVGRALARHALSRHAAVAPHAWQFEAASHGRLEIRAPERPGQQRLRFNISHSQGMVICAVVEELDVGVDVEARDDARVDPAIWEHFFAPPEVAAIAALPARDRGERFFAYWTLKEAYIKARGLGLAIPLDKFWFVLTPGAPATIGFAPPLDDDPQRWQFAQRQVGRHALAVAVASRDQPLRLSVERCVPLLDIVG